nr:MAG TPA: hypothetical protein [Caudoviricetes sp.]
MTKGRLFVLFLVVVWTRLLLSLDTTDTLCYTTNTIKKGD